MESKDLKSIWKSLNWRGTFDDPTDTQPSDNTFKEHFERLLSLDDTEDLVNCDNAPYIPVLDDNFVHNELESAVNSLNQNKSYCGICPGILKSLPLSWFLFLLTNF